jgi:hypothetical protein
MEVTRKFNVSKRCVLRVKLESPSTLFREGLRTRARTDLGLPVFPNIIINVIIIVITIIIIITITIIIYNNLNIQGYNT